MALYSRNDMDFTNYTWTTYKGDNPKICGEPDDTVLNRREGYEVLYFINKFAEIHRLTRKMTGLKIEKMICDQLPSHIQSQKDIKEWILKNWEQ